MKVPREAWWLGGAAILMMLIALSMGNREAQQSQQVSYQRTTYNSSPDGLRALYLTLKELGYDSRRMLIPFGRATMPTRGTLVVVQPDAFVPITGRELTALQRWAAKGHTVILAGAWLMADTADDFPVSSDLVREPPLTYAKVLEPTYLAAGVKRLAVRGRHRIETPRSGRASKQKREHEGFARRVTRGFYRAQISDALSTAVPLLGDDKGTVVAYARVGAGRVILLCSPWSLCNEGIATADNLIFFLNAIGRPQEGPVYFDEYHHGYRKNLAWAFMPVPLKIALGNLLLGLALLLYGRSRRLGAPVPADRATRDRSEFLGTMTALLRKGRATRLALRTAYETALQQLRLELGQDAAASVADLARAAARIHNDAGDRLGTALQRCRGALDAPGALSEAQAMALVRELDAATALVRQI